MDDPSRTLTPELLLNAYRRGFFPMADRRTGPIAVVFARSPRHHPPGLFPRAAQPAPHGRPRRLRDPHRHRLPRRDRRVRGTGGDVDLSGDRGGLCRAERARIRAQRGGVAAGRPGRGLYGISIGGAFFGESMFSRVSGASKVALVHLVRHLVSRGFLLLDSQFTNPHLVQFGVREITREVYLRVLERALGENPRF